MSPLAHQATLRAADIAHVSGGDYGILVANQFGRKAFHKGDASKIVVRPGEKIRIRYGVLIHSGPSDSRPDLAAAYEDYLAQAGK